MFTLGKSTVLGLDFGASAIKAVELNVSEKAVELLNFGEMDLHKIEDGLPPESSRTFDEEMTLRVRALLHKMKVETQSISLSIPAYDGLVTLAEFPYLDETELANAVQFEAKKYVPSKLEDILLSWDVLRTEPPSESNPGGKIQILLIAALRKEVEKYAGYVKNLGVEPVFEELEIFSLTRALTREKPGTLMIVDIGSKVTNLIIVQDSQIQANNTVPVGGKHITKTISDTMNIGKERADDLKKSHVDLLNSIESGLQFPVLETLCAEFKRLQELVLLKNPTAQCMEIILSGGGSQLVGLSQFFERKLGIPAVLGDPWKGIRMPKNFVRDSYFDTQFTVALGVALGQKNDTVKKAEIKDKKSALLTLLTKKL